MDEVKSEIYKYFFIYIYQNVLYDIKNVQSHKWKNMHDTNGMCQVQIYH